MRAKGRKNKKKKNEIDCLNEVMWRRGGFSIEEEDWSRILLEKFHVGETQSICGAAESKTD